MTKDNYFVRIKYYRIVQQDNNYYTKLQLTTFTLLHTFSTTALTTIIITAIRTP